MTHSTVSTPKIATHTSVELPTTMGVDLSDRISRYEVQRGDGHVLQKGKVAMTREALGALFEQWKGCRLVIETGGHSHWVSRLGTERGMDVVVANSRRLALISQSDRKCDRVDASVLTELGRTNVKLLYPVTHRSQEAQAHLAIQRSREQAVSTRTALINHVRGVFKTHGYRAPKASPECFGTRVKDVTPSELTAALNPMLRLIQQVNTQIKLFDQQLARLARDKYPITKLLQQIPGVGPIGSLTFVLTLEDPKRFEDARQVGAYFGLVPRQKSSGKSDPQMHITKAGNPAMRRLSVLSAHFIMGPHGPDCDLRRFGMKIAGDGSDKAAKKRACVAVARKILVLMYHLWRTGEAYDPFYLAKKRGEPVPA